MSEWATTCFAIVFAGIIGSVVIFLIGAAGIGIDGWLVKRLNEVGDRHSITIREDGCDIRGVQFNIPEKAWIGINYPSGRAATIGDAPKETK